MSLQPVILLHVAFLLCFGNFSAPLVHSRSDLEGLVLEHVCTKELKLLVEDLSSRGCLVEQASSSWTASQ